MNVNILTVLYIDNEAAVPAGLCQTCGGEMYGQDGFCLRCEGMAYDPG